MKQQAAEATIAAMLEAGAELLMERLQSSATGGLLGQVKATDIAAKVNKTTGAFFHWWPTQEAYREDLLAYLLSQDRMRELNVQGTVAAMEAVVAARGGIELADLARAGGVANFEDLRDGDSFEIQLLLTAARAGDPSITRELKSFYQSVSDSFVPVYKEFLAFLGLRFRAPYTVERFAVTLTGLAEGLHLRWLVDPDAVPESMERPPDAPPAPDGQDERWNLFASIVYTLIRAMTEPDPEAEPADSAKPEEE